MPTNVELRRSLLAEFHEPRHIDRRTDTSRNVDSKTLFASYTRAYKEKRYNAAARFLEQYYESCKEKTLDHLTLLDLQTDLHMKLNNPDLALQTSKLMIRLSRDDARGYLRASQALQSKSEFRTALKFIEYGLKNTSTEDKSHAKLVACANRLRSTISSNIVLERAQDRIPLLPPELLDMIFSYLDYRQCSIILRVSKLWQQRILSTDLMTHTVDFRLAKRRVTSDCVKAAFRRTRAYRKQLYLHNLNATAWQYINIEFGKWYQWSSLEVLEIDSSEVALPSHFFAKLSRLKAIRLPNLTESQSKIDVLLDCHNLESAVIPCHVGGRVTSTPTKVERPNLRNLTFTSSTPTTSFSQVLDFFSFPNLESLVMLRELHALSSSPLDLTVYPKLNSLILEARISSEGLRTPPSLLTLSISENTTTPQCLNNVLGTNLETLHLKGTYSMECLEQLIANGLNSYHLRELCLENIGDIGDKFEDVLGRGIGTQAEVFSRVETIKISQESLCDEHAGIVLSLFPRVRKIELQSPRITGLFVSDMIRHEDSECQLETVRLEDCDRVEPDLVPWARAKGVQVKIVNKRLQFDQGRKVRHE